MHIFPYLLCIPDNDKICGANYARDIFNITHDGMIIDLFQCYLKLTLGTSA